MTEATNSLASLINYVEHEKYQGWDPYDGLNSKIFKTLPLKHSALARLAWIQLFKRSPVNLRSLLLVPKGYNSKGIGLFLSSYSKILQHLNDGSTFPIDITNLEEKVHSLAHILLDSVSKGYSGMCWGYNFDWQARGGLYFPAGTPTVVATAYAAYGLFDAFEATNNDKYLKAAIDTQHFVLNDLSRDYRGKDEFLFSYSVVPGNNKVYNASLLGSKLLARIYSYTQNSELLPFAKASVNAVIKAQNDDGSWIYGEGPTQSWIDSFHSGFNLEALSDYSKFTGDDSIQAHIERGLRFYVNSFFTEEGVPKYYHNQTYPVDIHSPAQLAITIDALDVQKKYADLLDRVMSWTILNMQADDGYFFYQKKSLKSSKIPYMRWSQAWMMHALTTYLIATCAK